MIDRTKLIYQVGDLILYKNTVCIRGIIIGYFFFGGYNNYEINYGYTIKLINSDVIGHSIGSHAYDAYGNKITRPETEGYWWVLPDKAILIRQNLKFLLTL